MERAVLSKALDQQLEDGLAARTLALGATKHQSTSQCFLAMLKTTSSRTRPGEMAVTAAVAHSDVLI